MSNEEENGNTHWILGADGVWRELRELRAGTEEVREPLPQRIQELVDMGMIDEAEYRRRQQRPEEEPVQQPENTAHWLLHEYNLALRQELANRREHSVEWGPTDDDEPDEDYYDEDDDEDDDTYFLPGEAPNPFSAESVRGRVRRLATDSSGLNLGAISPDDRVSIKPLENGRLELHIIPGAPGGRRVQEVVIERNGRRWVIPLKDDLTKPGLPDI